MSEAAAPKKVVKAVVKKPKAKPSHPPTSEMVNTAIRTLKERGGSSLQAIKKYIAANYKVDVDKLAPFIKKYLKTAVTAGTLIQPKGRGASGSFKMSAKKAEKPAKKAKKPAAKKEKKVKKPAAKKTPKKAAKKTKAPKKEKKTKTPKKVKAPKPKTAKKPAAKKVAPKKK